MVALPICPMGCRVPLTSLALTTFMRREMDNTVT